MQIINFFALIGMTINDLVSIVSVIGSFMLLVGAVLNLSRSQLTQSAEWSILGLVFGGFTQIAMAVTSTTPEQVGILLPMHPALVDGLLLLSLMLFLAQWWIKKNKWRFS